MPLLSGDPPRELVSRRPRRDQHRGDESVLLSEAFSTPYGTMAAPKASPNPGAPLRKSLSVAGHDVIEMEEMPGKVAEAVLKTCNPSFEDLIDAVGTKHVVFQFAVQHIMEGAMYSLTYNAVPYILAAYHLPGPAMQVMTATVDNMWCFKVPFGILSDGFPVRGYNKSFYMIWMILAGMIGMAAVGTIPDMSLGCTFPSILAVQMMMAICDLLSQARCNEKCKDHPAVATRLLSFMNLGMLTWSVFAQLSLGSIIATSGPRAPYRAAFVMGAFVTVAVLCGTMDEAQKTPEQCAEDRQRVTSSRSIVTLGWGTALAISIMCVFAGFRNPLVSSIGQIVTAVGVITLFVKLTCPIFGKVCLFFFLQSALNPSIGGAAFYFFTDDKVMYPDGPHFGAHFYVSVVGSVSLLASFVGLVLFERYAPTMTYRKLLLFANLAPSILSVLDIILFSRLNRKWGLPDRAFLLGSAAMEKVFILWGTMPGYLIIAQMTPPNMTSIMSALVACSYYVGCTVSSHVGAMLLEVLGVTPEGLPNEGAKFDKLWVAALVVSIASLAPIFFLPKLIPEGGPQDDGKIVRLSEHEVFLRD